MVLVLLVIGVIVLMGLVVAVDDEGVVRDTGNTIYLDKVAEPMSWWQKLAKFLAFEDPMSCEIVGEFRADYKEGVRDSGVRVTLYGANCAVGERIVLLACEQKSGTYNNYCYRLFQHDYLKEDTDDRIDLSTACSGDCYAEQWYVNDISNKFVGYDCIDCNDIDTCTDSDNGETINVKGKVTYNNHEYIDVCLGGKLNEFYCVGGDTGPVDVREFDCPYGCADGKCNSQETCTPHASKKCYNGDVYWYDSCGAREGRFDDCGSGEDCVNGACKSCTAKSCTQLGKECGNQADGCGGTIDCGECTGGKTCQGGICKTGACVPKTCAQLGADCGSTSDGCGDMLSCGSCDVGYECTSNKCTLEGNQTTCAAYNPMKDGECTFSLKALFTDAGMKAFWDDYPYHIVISALVLIVGGYLFYTKRQGNRLGGF